MKILRALALFTLAALLATFLPALPAAAAGVTNLEQRLDDAIETENPAAPDCVGGNCGAGGSGGGGGSILSGLFGGGSGGGGFLQNLFGGLIDFFKNLFGGLFGGGGNSGGGDCGGGGGATGGGDCNTGGGTTGGDTGSTGDTGTTGDTGSTGTATTPDAGPTPTVGDVPSGRDALKSAIRAKFGITVADGQRAWTEAQLKSIYKTLSVLPENFRKWNRSMERGGNRGGMAGLGQVGGSGRIWIYDSAFQGDNGIGVIVHEMTHNFQGNQAVLNQWRSQIRGRSVSSYGNTNTLEDMAESVRAYYMRPAQMKQTHASRYNFIKQHIMGGREFTGNEWR